MPSYSKEYNTLYFHALGTKIVPSLPWMPAVIKEKKDNTVNVLCLTDRDTCCGSQSVNLRKCKWHFWIRLTTLTALTMGLDNVCECTPKFYANSYSNQSRTEEVLVYKCKYSGWEDREIKGRSTELFPLFLPRHCNTCTCHSAILCSPQAILIKHILVSVCIHKF